MSNNIKGKVVIITGARSGLGEAAASICQHLEQRLYWEQEEPERIEILAKEIKESGGEALAISVDVTTGTGKKLVDATLQNLDN